MPKTLELPGVVPLEPHANLRSSIPDRKYFTPPPPAFKNIPRGLHVTCMSGGDADCFSAPLSVFAHYATDNTYNKNIRRTTRTP